MPGSRPAASAVTVLVCDGARCRAVSHRTDTGCTDGEASTLLGALRERVRRSRDGVLIRSECLGACAHAPAAWLIRGGTPGVPGLLCGPVETPDQVRSLLDVFPVENDQ